MKKNLFMTGALVTALAMATTGCSNEDLTTDNVGKGDKKGNITEITAGTPQGGPSTRLAYEHMSVGGLKVEWEAQSSSNTEEFYAVSFLNGSTSYYKLIQSDNAPKASSSSFKVMHYNNGWSDGTIATNEETHALYPVKAAYEGVFQNNASTALSAPTLELNGQTGKLTDMKNFDYMTAVTTATSTLSLQFKHRIAVLCLKGLTFTGVTGNTSINSFSISGTGVKPSAKLTMTQGATTDAIAFTDIADAAIATSGSTFTITGGTQTENAYICFFPNAEMNEQEITVSATVGADTYTCKFTVPAEGFLEGNMYTLSGKEMTKEVDYTVAEIQAMLDENPKKIPAENAWTITDSNIDAAGYATLRAALTKANTDNRKISIVLSNITVLVSIPTQGAFQDCTALTAIEAPKATEIQGVAFFDCTSLASISFPVATTIGISMFYKSSLVSVSLPMAKDLGLQVFNMCEKLESVSLPKAETLGNNMFGSCKALKTVTIGTLNQNALTSAGRSLFGSGEGNLVPLNNVDLTLGEAEYNANVSGNNWNPSNGSGGTIPCIGFKSITRGN